MRRRGKGNRADYLVVYPSYSLFLTFLFVYLRLLPPFIASEAGWVDGGSQEFSSRGSNHVTSVMTIDNLEHAANISKEEAHRKRRERRESRGEKRK